MTTDLLSRPFVEALERGELVSQYCTDCATVQRLARDTQYPRLQWLVAVLLTGFPGAIAYYGWRVTQPVHGEAGRALKS